MNLKIVAAVVLGACLAIGVGLMVTHGPGSGSPSAALPAGPSAPPTGWPNYSSDGTGFPTPTTSDGELVAYGHQLVTRTFSLIGPEVSDTGKRYAGNNLSCQNCHLDAGTNRAAIPLVGVFRTYPKFSKRSAKTISVEERIEECMTRSMNGRALPADSREMTAFLAYLRFIGEPQAQPPSEPAEPEKPADAARGEIVFGRVCTECHQPDGLGKRWGALSDARGYRFPPLWGPDSYNDGAGMDHFDRAVDFVQHNMPRGIDPAKPRLTLQEAWDTAALLQSKPRPHFQPR